MPDPPAVGRDAIAGVAQGFMAAFPDLRVVMDDIVVDGDQTVYRWTLVGTNTGPGGTGKRVYISGFEEWRIGADGLIADSRGHFDSAEYQRQHPEAVSPTSGSMSSSMRCYAEMLRRKCSQ
jgi:predicted ester cyclase